MSAQINIDNFFKKSLQTVILFSIFLSPILFSTKHFLYFTTLKYVSLSFFGSICFLILLFYLLRIKFSISKNFKVLFSISGLFILWLLITSIFSADFNSSVWSNFGRHTGYLTYLFCFVFLVSSVFAFNKNNYQLPLKAFVLGGTLAALSVYLSPALLNVNWYFLIHSNSAGTFGNTTYAGVFLVFSVFSSIILIFQEKTTRKKWLWSVCFLIILLSPIFLNTKNIFTGNITSVFSLVGDARAGLLSILIGLVFSLILYSYFDSRKLFSYLSKIIPVLFFMIAVLILVNVFNKESSLHNSIIDNGQGARLVYWDMAVRGVSQRPILGWGLENFSIVHKSYFDPVLLSPNYPLEPWTDKPHNNILEIAFSSGLLGLLLYLILISFICICLIRKAQTTQGVERKTSALLFGLLTAYFFQLFFAFDTVSSLQAFFITIAIISIFCFEEIKHEGERKINKYLKTFIEVLIVILCILMIYYLSFNVGRESKMIRKLTSMPFEERVLIFEKTMNISPAGGAESESQYIDIVVTGYKQGWPTYNNEARIRIKKYLEFLLEYTTKTSDKYPENFRLSTLSSTISNMLYNISKEKKPELLEISKKYGIRSISNSPLNHLGYLITAEVYTLEGKLDQAIKFSQMATNLNPIVPQLHDVLIYLAKLKKDPKLIEQKTQEAKKFIPDYEYGEVVSQ